MDMFAATDSHGFITIYGFGNDDNYKRIPKELFFNTDYLPLIHDKNGYAIDQQTQQLPHLMQPPFIVDADGNPYDAELQQQNRLLKDLIRPLDPILLKTNENLRLAKLQIEEDCFVVEYWKQLEYENQSKQNHSEFLGCKKH